MTDKCNKRIYLFKINMPDRIKGRSSQLEKGIRILAEVLFFAIDSLAI